MCKIHVVGRQWYGVGSHLMRCEGKATVGLLGPSLFVAGMLCDRRAVAKKAELKSK